MYQQNIIDMLAASKTCTIEIFISDHYVFIINEPPSYFYSFGKNLIYS